MEIYSVTVSRQEKDALSSPPDVKIIIVMFHDKREAERGHREGEALLIIHD